MKIGSEQWIRLVLDGAAQLNLDISEQQVQVNANSVSSASFLIQPTKLGSSPLEVTLRTPASVIHSPVTFDA